MKLVSVAILAYNEEGSIADALQSVFEQSLFCEPSIYLVELFVIPNGCKDKTAEIARSIIDANLGANESNRVSASVVELINPGKHLAWNYFVHSCASPNSNYMIFVDADVVFQDCHAMSLLLEALERDQYADIAAGKPIKRIEVDASGGLARWISIGVTKLRRGAPGNICGMLYCGRSTKLRSFRLPPVLMGEDAFVRAMTVTSCFTRPDEVKKVLFVEESVVIFESYSSYSEVLRNKTRRMIELAINSVLYSEFWLASTSERHAGDITKEWATSNPDMSYSIIRKEIDRCGSNFVPRDFVFFQFSQLKHHSIFRKLALFIPALATVCINWIAVRRANRAICSGHFRDLWNKPSSSA